MRKGPSAEILMFLLLIAILCFAFGSSPVEASGTTSSCYEGKAPVHEKANLTASGYCVLSGLD
jgi:hypothetical protein